MSNCHPLAICVELLACVQESSRAAEGKLATLLGHPQPPFWMTPAQIESLREKRLMHVVVIFHNIGGYHAARLRAAHAMCRLRGWRLTAVQMIDRTPEHPWGNVKSVVTFPLLTLIAADTNGHRANQKALLANAPPRLSAVLDDLRPDVVVTPGWGFSGGRTARQWSRRHRAALILLSESKGDDERRYWWKELFKSRRVRHYDAALVGGERYRQYLVALGFAPERIFSGYEVVDNDYFVRKSETARRDLLAARRRQPEIPTRPFFLAATRLIERKNVTRLVEAFALYRRQVGPQAAWELIICGSGQQEQAVRDCVARHQLTGAIHLPGFVTYEAIGDWYGSARAFIHPALREQWGLVVNEACAAGLPVLCSNTVGAGYEIVQDGRNGLLFDPHCTADMASALWRMHSMDDEARARMGQASREIIANYSPRNFAAGLMNSIDAAVSTRPQAATQRGRTTGGSFRDQSSDYSSDYETYFTSKTGPS